MKTNSPCSPRKIIPRQVSPNMGELSASPRGEAINSAQWHKRASAPNNSSASFHALRHRGTSRVTLSGAPLLLVAKSLGHVDTRMGGKALRPCGPQTLSVLVLRSLGSHPIIQWYHREDNRWQSAGVHVALVAQRIGHGIRRTLQRITLQS